MIFSQPISFNDALRSRAAKAALPNDLSSAELLAMDAKIGERANVIAGATNAAFFGKVDDVVRGLMTPVGGRSMSKAQARQELMSFLRSVGYRAEPGEEGTIRDLSSFARLNLIIETQVKMAYGFGQFERGNTRVALWQWPAWEFVRLEHRVEPRDWPTRWDEQGGQFYPGAGPYPEGRMIARKDSSIWSAISAFGLPYAPFDFNSGMGLAPVPRLECERLGVVRRDQAVPPTARDFNEVAIAMRLDGGLLEAAQRSLGPGYEVSGGVLRRRAS